MGLPGGGDAASRCFSAWRRNLRADADVSRDVRMMVPVLYDEQRKKTKVWAFLGWRRVAVDAEYRVPPTVLAVDPLMSAEKKPGQPPPVLFRGDRYQLAVPIMVEVYVERLLNRDEFRRHCDRFKSREAILESLK